MRKQLKQCIAVVLSLAIVVTVIPMTVNGAMVCRASSSDNFCIEATNGTNTFSAPLAYSAVSGTGSSWQMVRL